LPSYERTLEYQSCINDKYLHTPITNTTVSNINHHNPTERNTRSSTHRLPPLFTMVPNFSHFLRATIDVFTRGYLSPVYFPVFYHCLWKVQLILKTILCYWLLFFLLLPNFTLLSIAILQWKVSLSLEYHFLLSDYLEIYFSWVVQILALLFKVRLLLFLYYLASDIGVPTCQVGFVVLLYYFICCMWWGLLVCYCSNYYK
jgi:hypothetical protein